MKRLAYLLIGDFKESPGVMKKVKNEIKAFENAGIECELINVVDKNSKFVAALPFSSKQNFSKVIIPDNIDCLYVRHVPLTFPLVQLMEKAKDKGIKVVMEIGTYPSYRAELKEISNPITYYRDVFYANKLENIVDRIVICTNFTEVYNVPAVQITNMIKVDDIKQITSYFFGKDEAINVLAVARLAYWHGYDRFIEGLHRYYSTFNETRNVIFHVVGVGIAYDGLQNLARKYGLEEHVKFYGQLIGTTLDEMYEIADIGIDCLGTHRKDDTWFGTLKSMEYLGKGLPFITEYPIPESVNEVKKYILKVPADESPVDIESVISFYMKLKEEQKQDIVSNMRKFAYSYCDISVAMKPVIDYLLEE